MTKAIAETYNVLNENIKLINISLLFGCLFLLCFYAVSVFSVVSKTVVLQKIESKISMLSGDINNLDSEYLSLSSNISLDDLSNHNMIKGKVTEYIPRSNGVASGITADSNIVALVNER